MCNLDDSIRNSVKEVNFLYQRVVDVNVLLSDYFHCERDDESMQKAADILNKSRTLECRCTDSGDFEVYGTMKWEAFGENEKRMFFEDLALGIKNLQDIFWEMFDILYRTIRKDMFEDKKV